MIKSLLLVSLLFSGVAYAADEAAAPAAATTTASVAGPADIGSEFDGLGGNRILLEKAKALNPEQSESIVQERTVSLRNRFELSPEYSGTFNGDTYSKTQSLGLNANYHINPQWALGVKFNYSFNKLTPEGERMMDAATADFAANPNNPTRLVPDMDYQKTELLALVNWAPIYGKMNLLDRQIVHFDVYGLAGAGQVQLLSGPTQATTAGIGIGFWFNQHLTSRLEMRYENYTAQYLDGEKNLGLTIASAQMGWLL